MNHTIRAKSSGEDPYLVEFTLDGNQLRVSCNCQAGIFGKLCKHKTELLEGDAKRLFDESDMGLLDEVCAIAERAPELIQLSKEIAEAEKIIKTEQAKVKKAKKNLEAALRTGIAIEES
jgi:uncharacterized Zn finger protein